MNKNYLSKTLKQTTASFHIVKLKLKQQVLLQKITHRTVLSRYATLLCNLFRRTKNNLSILNHRGRNLNWILTSSVDFETTSVHLGISTICSKWETSVSIPGLRGVDTCGKNSFLGLWRSQSPSDALFLEFQDLPHGFGCLDSPGGLFRSYKTCLILAVCMKHLRNYLTCNIEENTNFINIKTIKLRT